MPLNLPLVVPPVIPAKLLQPRLPRGSTMTTWRTWLKEDLQLFSLLFTTPERRLRTLYDAFSHNYFTEKSHFLNLGYWKDSPDTLDAACEALANLVGEAGEFKS